MLLENFSLPRNLFSNLEFAHPGTFVWICVGISCCNLNISVYDTEIRVATTDEPQRPPILAIKQFLNKSQSRIGVNDLRGSCSWVGVFEVPALYKWPKRGDGQAYGISVS
jgi:hypothetical protein